MKNELFYWIGLENEMLQQAKTHITSLLPATVDAFQTAIWRKSVGKHLRNSRRTVRQTLLSQSEEMLQSSRFAYGEPSQSTEGSFRTTARQVLSARAERIRGSETMRAVLPVGL